MQNITLKSVTAILCSLLKKNFNSRLLKKTIYAAVLFLFLSPLQAQQSALKSLTVGDYLPDIVFHDLLNYKKDSATLKEFKGKLLILDFWGPYCKSCIKVMSKLDSLQSIFKDDIQFIMVTETSESESSSEALSKLFRKWKQAGLFVPSLLVTGLGNHILSELFPHEFVPHYVWINRFGKVCAITTYHLMNAHTIQAFLKIK
jgi:thiol-disulfide isomerase/thioredoxin